MMPYFTCAGASTTMLQSHQHGTPCKLLLSFALGGTYILSPLVLPEVILACIGRHLYSATLQAVYGAFARFRARHCLGAPQQQQPSPAVISEGEATAVRMLQHVSGTVSAAAAPTTEGDARGTLSDPEVQQAGHSGMRSIPSQQSDLPSLASMQAEQGSADRQAMLSILSLKQLDVEPFSCPQMFLCLHFRCRDDVSELKTDILGLQRAAAFYSLHRTSSLQ